MTGSRAGTGRLDSSFPTAWQVVATEIEALARDSRRRPVVPVLSDDELRKQTEHLLDSSPIPLPNLTLETARLLREGSVHVTSPRYFGLFNPSTLEAGIVGDALVAAFNPQLAVRSHAPAAATMERVALEYFESHLGFGQEEIHSTFTTGGAEANLSAVLTALLHRYPNYGDHGMRGLERRPAVYLSGESHHSFTKIARMLGLGTQALKQIQTTSEFTIDPEHLRTRIQADLREGWDPLLVVGTAGTTGAGVIDPLEEIGEIASSLDIWFHVDAAWGGTALLSPKLRGGLRGIHRADSVTWDAHKWLSVPMGAGMFFCRHPEAVQRAFAVKTSYMPPSTDQVISDGYHTTAQWSRRAIGVKVFLSLAHLGVEGYRHLVERQAQMGDVLRELLERKGWAVVNSTPLPLVCFTHPDLQTGGSTTRELLAEIYRRGIVWISDVSVGGREPALRACITSFRTSHEDLQILVEELEAARASLAGRQRATAAER